MIYLVLDSTLELEHEVLAREGNFLLMFFNLSQKSP